MFNCKELFWYFSGWSGRTRLLDGNSDNRANSAQVQLNLPTRAELGKSKKKETSTVVESKAVLTEPKDEIVLEEIQQEVCEKVFVIPRHKVDNHNIGI